MATSRVSSTFRLLEGESDLFVELRLPVYGKSLPADHGYGAYSTFSHLIPALHQEHDVSLLTVPGFPDYKGEITITKQSCFKIRVPVSKIPLVYPLAGKRVSIGKHEIQLGIPEISVLRPALVLRSRIVVIKGYTEPEEFQKAAQRQLEQIGIIGQVTIPLDYKRLPSRKTIKIKQHSIIGFTAEVANLSPEDSVKLQVYGLGGKRRMGCGIFVPISEGK